ncbi:DUF4260 family protein [Anditalea andensis]
MLSRWANAWWIFPTIQLLPELALFDYLISSTSGAWPYHLCHPKC